MININSLETHKIILEENIVFDKILRQIDRKEIITKAEVENILENYALKNKLSKKKLIALSYENLVDKNIFIEKNTQDYTYIKIIRHIKEMFNHISKQGLVSLSSTQFQEHINTMENYLKKLERFTRFSLKNDTFYEEKESFFKFLDTVDTDIQNSITTLLSKKEELSKDIINNQEKHKKLENVKYLRLKHINPLKTFLDIKKSNFLKTLEEMIELFKNNSKLEDDINYLERTLMNHKFDLKKVLNISSYINNYIKQTEFELYLNTTVEKRILELLDIVESESTGNQNKKYLWNNENVFKIKHFFNNAIASKKDENINTKEYNQDTLEDLTNIVLDKLNMDTMKKKQIISENKRFEEEKLLAKKQKEEYNDLLSLKNDFDIYIQNTFDTIINSNLSIPEYIINFLENIKDWNTGYYLFLYQEIINKANDNNLYININNKEYVQIKNKETIKMYLTKEENE